MRPDAIDSKISTSSPILTMIIRKSLIIYIISAAIVPLICFVFGWRSLENIATGYLYGSLGLALFGALVFAGNTVPAQLSRLSLPKYNAPSLNHDQEVEIDGSSSRNRAIRFLFTTLICGGFLLLTGLFLKML